MSTKSSDKCPCQAEAEGGGRLAGEVKPRVHEVAEDKADAGVGQPQAGDCLGPPEAGGGQGGSSPRNSRASVALLTLILDLWRPAL